MSTEAALSFRMEAPKSGRDIMRSVSVVTQGCPTSPGEHPSPAARAMQLSADHIHSLDSARSFLERIAVSQNFSTLWLVDAIFKMPPAWWNGIWSPGFLFGLHFDLGKSPVQCGYNPFPTVVGRIQRISSASGKTSATP